MALTKQDRDALPDEHFAVPGKRQLPINDANHTKLAWDMVERTKDLSESERESARSRIIRRAKELGIDTSTWKLKSLSISAMSLSVPSTPDHPNKAPFSGILVRLDEPSDGSPHGAMGCKIILTEKAAAAALPSLLGMAINYQPDLAGHDPQAKIGIIDDATIETDSRGPYVQIGGFFYAADFPVVTTQIKAEKGFLGFSFEAERIFIEDPEANPLVISALTFTGAAVLQKSKAAYQSTRIAAHADEPNNGDIPVTESEKILAKLEEMGTRLEKIESGETARITAASVADKVQKHADALHKCADGMSAAGIGMHPTRGHVAILHDMADKMMSDAHSGNMSAAYSGSGMYSAAVVEPAKPDAATTALITELKASLASMETKLSDLKAAGTRETAPPARRTVAPEISRLMAKAGIEAPEDGKMLSLADVDNALKTITDPTQRMTVKNGLNRAGILAAA